jgi:hypothetical protein
MEVAIGSRGARVGRGALRRRPALDSLLPEPKP